MLPCTRRFGPWQPLSVFLREHLPSRDAPLRADQPIGPYRLDNMFGALRKDGRIEVRGREGPLAEPKLIPPVEWFGRVLHEQSERMEHVHSGRWLYGVEVRIIDPPPMPAAPLSLQFRYASDRARLVEMIRLIDDGMRPWTAAGKVAPEAEPLRGELESRQRRLYRLARALTPDEVQAIREGY